MLKVKPNKTERIIELIYFEKIYILQNYNHYILIGTGYMKKELKL